MTDNPYKEYEDELERKIGLLERFVVDGELWDEKERELSDLKHQLWQSRL